MIYLPQGVLPGKRFNTKNRNAAGYMGSARPSHKDYYVYQGSNYPSSIIEISNADRTNSFHPTQKPVKLYEYLQLTYTNEGETILDFASGSGTCAIAADNLKRNWICIEKDQNYYEISKKRINENRSRLNAEGYNLLLLD